MKKTLLILLSGFLGFQFISCETIVEDIDPKMFSDISEKLVMTSFISPQDTMIYVKITVSTPLFGDLTKSIANVQSNAVVTIANSSTSIQLPFLTKEMAYGISTKQFKIEAGKTYTLKAKTDKLSVEASTTVPLENAKIDRYTLSETDVIRKIFTGQNTFTNDTIKNYEVLFYWKDIKTSTNFYKLSSSLFTQYLVPSILNNTVIYKYQILQSVVNWNDDDFPSTKSYFSDKNNTEIELKSAKGDLRNSSGFQQVVTLNGQTYRTKTSSANDKIYVYLSNLSKEYYHYGLSLAAFSSARDNPFAEPAPIFTNVKNGLGCFAGYNKTEFIIKPKK